MELWQGLLLALTFFGLITLFVVREERRLRYSRNELALVDSLPYYLSGISERIALRQDLASFSQASVELIELANKLRRLFRSNLWPFGVLLSSPVSILKGEELYSLAKDRHFRQKLSNTLLNVTNCLSSRDLEGLYQAASEYCYVVLTRGKTPAKDAESTGLIRFVKSLEKVKAALEKMDVSMARDEMREWYRRWRGDPTVSWDILSAELMGQALFVVQVVLQLYGDTLDWLNTWYATELIGCVARLVDLTKENMENYQSGVGIRHLTILEERRLFEVMPTRAV